jgi:hypothetical protein
MAEQDPTTPRSQPPALDQIRYVKCPACGSPSAVVAATNYRELMCFCPACEHVWDCAADPIYRFFVAFPCNPTEPTGTRRDHMPRTRRATAILRLD